MPLSRSGIRFFWIVLVVALVVVAWLLSSLFQTNAFNVRATIRDFPPGVAQTTAAWSGPEGTQDKGIEPGSGTDGTQDKGTEPGSEPGGSGDKEPEPEGSADNGSEPEPEPEGVGDNGSEPAPLLGGGSPPLVVQLSGQGNPISISTVLIDYGVVFPGESLTSYFIVQLTGSETQITYTITLLLKAPYEDMRPYLTVEKVTETDTEPDPIADGPTGDYTAEGTLTSGSDTSDKWWVTFEVPDDIDNFGEYQADIEIEEIVD